MKSPRRVAAGRVNGIKSGVARFTTDAERRWKAAERRRRAYWTAIAEGRCVDCGATANAGTRCDDCRVAAAARHRAYYQGNAEVRKAYQRRYQQRKKAA
jgi:hypothetical protein